MNSSGVGRLVEVLASDSFASARRVALAGRGALRHSSAEGVIVCGSGVEDEETLYVYDSPQKLKHTVPFSGKYDRICWNMLEYVKSLCSNI